MAIRPDAIRGLVDLERGVISREIFVNEDIYQQEQERIFARVGYSWVTRARCQRGMYRRWAELMTAESWSRLMPLSGVRGTSRSPSP